jgi:hypothetical protein
VLDKLFIIKLNRNSLRLLNILQIMVRSDILVMKFLPNLFWLNEFLKLPIIFLLILIPKFVSMRLEIFFVYGGIRYIYLIFGELAGIHITLYYLSKIKNFIIKLILLKEKLNPSKIVSFFNLFIMSPY